MRNSRFLISFVSRVLVPVFLVVLTQPVSATVYKWKDEQGKTHFTDNPGQVPKQYREPSRLEQKESLAPPPVHAKPVSGKKVGPVPDAPGVSQAEIDKLRDLNEDEKKVFEEAMKFLDEDAKRYEEFYDRPRHYRFTFKQMHQKVLDTVPEKKATVEKLKGFEANKLFQETAGFLSGTLVEDEKVTLLGLSKILRTSATLARVKEDAITKTKMVKKLEEELQSRTEEMAKKKEMQAKLEKQESGVPANTPGEPTPKTGNEESKQPAK